MEVPKSLFLPLLPLHWCWQGSAGAMGRSHCAAAPAVGVSWGLTLAAGEQLEPLGKLFLLPVEMGGTGTVRAKVSISMRAASLELSREGGTAACPRPPLLLSVALTSTFRREKRPAMGAWGSCCLQGHIWALGVVRLLEEGARRGV